MPICFGELTTKHMAARERAARVLKKVTQETEELQEELSMAMCLDDAESLLLLENELGLAKPLPVRKKKDEHPAPPHRRFDLGFALAWAGLSAKGNHYVTFRLAVADDVWFHAQGVPGSHAPPAVGAVFADLVGHAAHAVAGKDRGAAVLAVEGRDRHAPGALTADAPVGAVAHHGHLLRQWGSL